MILDQLKAIDPRVHTLPSQDGQIWLSPGLQGRIFCCIGDTLTHKLDFQLAATPTPDFNNIGGNSLWPAPEGGAFAFNYPHGKWEVQPAINTQCPDLTVLSEDEAALDKDIILINRKGISVKLAWHRYVKAVKDIPVARKHQVAAVAYQTEESLTAKHPYPTDQAILNAWSLEQFQGAENIVAFGKFKEGKPEQVLNLDHYGDPKPRLTIGNEQFTFKLGGPERLQIGIKKDCQPLFIGAYDPAKNLLIIRQNKILPGTYINIADNDQPNGPYSTEDVYSIFNGAELNFFELETIAPMVVEDHHFISSTLETQTTIFQGPKDNLLALLKEDYDVIL